MRYPSTLAAQLDRRPGPREPLDRIRAARVTPREFRMTLRRSQPLPCQIRCEPRSSSPPSVRQRVSQLWRSHAIAQPPRAVPRCDTLRGGRIHCCSLMQLSDELARPNGPVYSARCARFRMGPGEGPVEPREARDFIRGSSICLRGSSPSHGSRSTRFSGGVSFRDSRLHC
jgi:hypothetical protein